MVKCKYEGTGIWNGRCIGTKEVDPCPGYDKCKQYKPNYTTNADRIRAMSDEELAVLLAHETYRMAKPVFDVLGYGITEEFIFAQRLEWLKQPAEGD